MHRSRHLGSAEPMSEIWVHCRHLASEIIPKFPPPAISKEYESYSLVLGGGDFLRLLKLSGSRQSRRPSAVSACGYIKKPIGPPLEPGSVTSCAKLYAIQFISQAPNRRERADFTRSSSSARFPGGSSSTTFRTSAGSTGTQPYSRR